MDKEQLRDDNNLNEEEAARYVGISVAMLKAAFIHGWLDTELTHIKPSIKELGLPLKENPDNVATYRVGDLKALKDRLANNPEDLARLRSLVKD